MASYNDEDFHYECDSDSSSVDLEDLEVALYSQMHFEGQSNSEGGSISVLSWVCVHSVVCSVYIICYLA